MYARAQTDLARPSPEAHLRWIFWHARAVGRLEVARYALKRVEAQDCECHTRAMCLTEAGPLSLLRERYEAARPTLLLKTATEVVIEAAAYAEAARAVAGVLGAVRR